MMTDDEWKLIDCIAEGKFTYSINRFSLEIKNNKTGKILNGYIDDNGYRRIRLNDKNYRYHRIIAQIFLPNPDNLQDIDHINHDKLDNRICNLRWVTRYENNMNRTKSGTKDLNLIDILPNDIVPLKYNDIIYENIYYSKSLDCVCMQRVCDVICYSWCVNDRTGLIFTQIPISVNKRKSICKNKLLRELNIE